MEENKQVEQKNTVEEKNIMKDVKNLVEKELERLVKVGIQNDNIDCFDKLVDIHKDIENECYWGIKKEVMEMRYSDYDEGKYGMDRMYGPDEYDGDYGNYGRRGVPGTGRSRSRRYRGSESEEMMERMKEHFGDYEYSKEEFGRGNYGAKGETMKSLEYMLQSAMEFIKRLQDEADSPEEVQLVKKYAKKIGMM